MSSRNKKATNNNHNRTASLSKTPMIDITPIATTSDLEAFMDHCRQTSFVTVDTEFIRETTYWPKLCLIQIASPTLEKIIDPLAPNIDLTSLWELMADEAVVKVFHAARQDIEIIFKLGEGLIPKPLFDTQIAAMVCGFGEQVGYAKLVEHFHKVAIDKSSQFTDWAQRPLSKKQLNYALSDVTYLRDIYLKLKTQLEANGRASWLGEEMGTLTATKTYQTNPADAWRRLKKRLKSKKQIAITRTLCEWREQTAQNRNIPRGRVLKDDAIYEIASHAPQTVETLSRIRALPNHIAQGKDGRALLEAVKQGLAIDPQTIETIHQNRPLSEKESAIADLFRVFLKAVAAEHNVASKLIGTAKDLDRLASSTNEDNNPLLNGWRGELFGKLALELKDGKRALRVKNNKVETFEIS